MTPAAVYTVWGVSLVLGAVVLLVVAVLLELILRTASRIDSVVGDVWTAGQGVANNTIHIALLRRTNATAGRILEAVGGVLGAVTAVHAHAQSCPRCPTCAMGNLGGGPRPPSEPPPETGLRRRSRRSNRGYSDTPMGGRP